MARSQYQSKWDEFQPYLQPVLRSARRLRYRIAAASRDLTLEGVLKRYVFRVHTLLILVWIWVLHWGEVRVYDKEVSKCDWSNWERWPSTATPHRVAFIADPQLIDPHTYPGRPWPLSSLTISFTDKYLKRSYWNINRRFDPDTLYFLGDLFDGGREWSTGGEEFTASEDQWKRYGRKYWLGEYNRFAKIFLDSDQISGGLPYRREKNVILSLPGNHDLGFAKGVQLPVRKRFGAYFGGGDRVDIIGNHSFVGVDTVSLSAMEMPDAPQEIWQPTKDFLDGAKKAKRRAIERHLGRTTVYPDGRQWFHDVREPQDQILLKTPHTEIYKLAPAELPTVLLTHVPLFREAGTPCGQLREKYPPTDPNKRGQQNDERNSIRIAGGYQYQNVVTKALSKLITEKVGNVGHAFSGDDHDYCEVVHRAYPSSGSGIREITVKSISWAMGIHKPGIVLASLWNPINSDGDPEPGSPQALRAPTIHTHLCILPNQLAVFIQYAFYLVVTLIVLFVHSIVDTARERNKPVPTPVDSLLPTKENGKLHLERNKSRSRAASGAANSEGNGFLAARSANARARSVSPGVPVGGYGLPTSGKADAPLIDRAGYYGPSKAKNEDEDSWIDDLEFELKPISRRRRSFALQVVETFRNDILWVGGPSIAWFLWLWHSH